MLQIGLRVILTPQPHPLLPLPPGVVPRVTGIVFTLMPAATPAIFGRLRLYALGDPQQPAAPTLPAPTDINLSLDGVESDACWAQLTEQLARLDLLAVVALAIQSYYEMYVAGPNSLAAMPMVRRRRLMNLLHGVNIYLCEDTVQNGPQPQLVAEIKRKIMNVYRRIAMAP